MVYLLEDEAERYERLDFGDLPQHLWDEFPESGEYIMHIMKFCGYKSRDAILRLKDEQEVTNMFKTAIELQELIPEEDRKITFGIFEKNPTMLKVLPGVDPGFKRFLKMVEGLVPKTVTKKRCLTCMHLNDDDQMISSQLPLLLKTGS